MDFASCLQYSDRPLLAENSGRTFSFQSGCAFVSKDRKVHMPQERCRYQGKQLGLVSYGLPRNATASSASTSLLRRRCRCSCRRSRAAPAPRLRLRRFTPPRLRLRRFTPAPRAPPHTSCGVRGAPTASRMMIFCPLPHPPAPTRPDHNREKACY